MIVTIHQPEFLPYIGFFERLTRCDLFILLDHVQYQKGQFINRNRIKTERGAEWITVPIVRKGYLKPINSVKIQSGTELHKKIWGKISSYYRHAAYFKEYAPGFEDIILKSWDTIASLNEALIGHCMALLHIDIPIRRSSDMKVEGKSTEMLVNICKAVGADTYLSGPGGKQYMDLSLFEKASIPVIFQEFVHPEYPQQFPEVPFVSHLSILDLIFNCGEKSIDILRNKTI